VEEPRGRHGLVADAEEAPERGGEEGGEDGDEAGQDRHGRGTMRASLVGLWVLGWLLLG